MNYCLFLVITTACNLLCHECSTLCDKKSQWFIKKEDFIRQLEIIKKIFIGVDTVEIIGGEALLHPNFFEFCDLAHKICPNKFFKVWTNGILLNTISNEKIKELYNKNIIFTVSIYPNLIDNFEQQEKRFKENNVELQILGSRIYFFKNILDKEGTQDIKKQYNNCYSFQEQNYRFFIYKNRIYNCCISPYIKDYLKLSDNNQYSLDIYKINNEKEVINFFKKPLEICSYCGNEKICPIEENVPWTNNLDFKEDYYISLKDLYLNDYEKYSKIYHNKKTNSIIINALKNKTYFKNLNNIGNHEDISYHYLNRFINGKLDIIILFSSEIDDIKLINLINFININKIKNFINIHFISLNSNKKIEKYIYETFIPFQNNYISFWFYKIKNIDNLSNIINNFCYGKYLYIYELTNKKIDNICNKYINKLIKK